MTLSSKLRVPLTARAEAAVKFVAHLVGFSFQSAASSILEESQKRFRPSRQALARLKADIARLRAGVAV